MDALAEPAPDTLVASLSRGPDALYALLAERIRSKPGFSLLTLLAPHAGGDRLVRLYSSNIAQYPLGDADPVDDSRWFRQLFGRKEPVIANDPEAIRGWLPDYSEFEAMGYGSLANLPVVVAGETIGVMNLMGAPGHFSAANIAAITQQLPLAALAIFSCEATSRRLALGR